ncbi:nitrogenase cofactor biosynthesis protein NifB [Malaciobacter molluscorum LMG 25693]|uniref:FeMo cofactor biosynthesis protein NifB n=1 Tax=Malaciobacter molluscorum LMG 25693 TaxID=870501 RepID=A0A2G1DJ94_9BACT|nr:nitrogenase cofactor biosynthesis protein NifB [Malaciobacter molluscorum]AXX93221.1 nitrogenase [Fe-Mo] cofactor synthase, NifB protein [Malaciobacter molluscorum LMG 25693]PHO18474.1 nitrogenase cofactor biosynthesis protein NifB [Malaciobacter molluscorum LMG 25693]
MSCSCTSSSTNNTLQQDVMDKINNHPCYSEGAHQHYARIHLAVAPACNIQCNYCNRKFDCSNESRPGVTSSKLSPIDAVKKVLYVGGKIQQLSVVGIAGPGDALANPKKTFETFKLLQEKAPDLKLCLSTNGLRLPEFIDEIVKYNIDHVTVTINSVDETGEIGSKIYPWIHWKHKKVFGKQAAKILLKQQIEGIKMLTQKGILVKANSVLIPGVNDKEIANVAKKLKELNVFLHNIMPLLSKPEFGTYYGLNNQRSATDQEVMQAQEVCGMDIKLMAHCRQCRADAVGLIGEDKSNEYNNDIFKNKSWKELEDIYNIKAREQRHALIENWRKALDSANERVKIEQASKEQLSSNNKTKLIAVTSSSEGIINLHFGSATEFLIYEAGNKAIKFVMHRKVQNAYCKGPEDCDGSYPIEEIKQTLKDIDLLLTEKIGDCPQEELRKIDLITDDSYALEPIEKSVFEATKKHFFYEKEKEVN